MVKITPVSQKTAKTASKKGTFPAKRHNLSNHYIQIKTLTGLVMFMLYFFSAAGLSALPGISIGLGVEGNANTRENFALGGGLSVLLDVSRDLAAGIKTTFSYDFSTVGAWETAALFRYYLPLDTIGPFIQAEAGCIVFFEHGEVFPAFSGGVRTGWRFSFDRNWYVEPSIRGGYPFMWGAGIVAGLKLGAAQGH